MKRRIELFAVVMVLVLSVVVVSSASTFVLRNGIQWYMTKDKVLSLLKTENGFDDYTIKDETNDAVRELLIQYSPNEKTNPKLWMLYIFGISLGKSDETVYMSMLGTINHGLTEACYWITLNNPSEENYYNRVLDLKAQLEKKYGAFEDKDEWKKRKSIKQGNYVYQAWKYLDDNTSVYLHIQKIEGGYEIGLEYQCGMNDEIKQSIQDGSLYIDPAFGL